MSRRPSLGSVIPLACVALFALEAWLFLEIGGRIGLLPTLAWIFFSFLLGLRLMRVQGLRMLFQIHLQLQRGVVPAEEMLNGLAVVMGGLMLMLPGYFTDFVGLLLLFPPTRMRVLSAFARPLVRWLGGGAEPATDVPPSQEVIEIKAQSVEKDSQPA